MKHPRYSATRYRSQIFTKWKMNKPFVWNLTSSRQHWQISSVVIPICNAIGENIKWGIIKKHKYINDISIRSSPNLWRSAWNGTYRNILFNNMKSVEVLDRNKLIIFIRKKHTFTRSRFSEVTENRPLICTRLALDLSSKESLNPNKQLG